MWGLGDDATREVVAYRFEQLYAERDLLLSGKDALQTGDINGLAAGLDALQQGCAHLSHRCEQGLDFPCCQARLIQVEESIIACLSIAQVVGNFALQGNGAREPGSENGEV